jgi:hypothetical protein
VRLYVVVEGETEQRVLPIWLQCINPTISRVSSVALLDENTFYLISGGGYPNYLRVVANAAEDVRSRGVADRLVIIGDAEEKTVSERRMELELAVGELPPGIQLRVVVQNRCFESWALGNRRVCTKNTQNPLLRQFRAYHDVLHEDPELMGTIDSEKWNRAQFAYKYLALLLQEKQAVYTKSNPRYLASAKYFDALQRRVQETSHIATFADFIAAVT